MEGLLTYLAEHIADEPYSIVNGSRFQLQADEMNISPLLTVDENDRLLELEWDENTQTAEMVSDEALNSDGRDIVQVGAVDGVLVARVGEDDAWQTLILHSLNRDVLRWLIDTAPGGQELCRERES